MLCIFVVIKFLGKFMQFHLNDANGETDWLNCLMTLILTMCFFIWILFFLIFSDVMTFGCENVEEKKTEMILSVCQLVRC